MVPFEVGQAETDRLNQEEILEKAERQRKEVRDNNRTYDYVKKA